MASTRSVQRLRGLVLLALGLHVPSYAAGATKVLEAFKYPSPGVNLNGQNGGVGFSGPWHPGGFNATSFDNYDLSAFTPTYQNFPTSGLSVLTRPLKVIGGIARTLAEPISKSDTRTFYVSVLLHPYGILNQGIFNGFFGLYLDGSMKDLFMGKPGGGALNRYVIEERGGLGQVASGSPVTLNQTAMLLLRVDMQPGLDRFTLYVNPLLCPAALPTPAVKADIDIGDLTDLVIYSSGAFVLDEIRMTEDLSTFFCPPLPFLGRGAPPLGSDAGTRFRRGDVSGVGSPDMAGAVRILSYLYLGGAELPCQDAADVDDSGQIEMTDAVHLLNFLFLGGYAPAAPGPFDCGEDSSEDGLINCEEYATTCTPEG